MAPSYEQAVAAWTAHLRSGGTTTWADFRAADATPDSPVPFPLPDAVHLELVRRINLTGPPGAGAPGLHDLVLTTASPGRGLVDVPLPWQPAPHRFGTHAIEPERVPDTELLRLAVGLLARLLPVVPSPESEPDLARWPRPWQRRFRLYGAPRTAEVVRRTLLVQGLVESDWRPVHVVLARPVEAMMAEHWAAATRAGGRLKWATVWRRVEAAGVLPRRLEVAEVARRLVDAQRGRRRDPVHVVIARDAGTALSTVSGLLGVHGAGLPVEDDDPAHTDLLRRLNRVTTLSHGPALVRRSAATLGAVLESVGSGDDVPLGVPAPALDWARRTADRLARDLAAAPAGVPDGAGYAVHGDPGVLAPSETGLSGALDPRRTLEAAVGACLEAWRRQEGSP
jgi:hypothetical protein